MPDQECFESNGRQGKTTILLYNRQAGPFLNDIRGILNDSLNQKTFPGFHPFAGQFPEERGISCIGQKLEQLGRTFPCAFLPANNFEEITLDT